VGPQHGVDVGIVEIGDKAVSFTCDPVFIVPEYGWERAAWFAIHILASDAVTSGLKPCFLAIDLNFPMEITKGQLEIVWATMHRECEKLGISIVCGHTARYENCHYPMVGGATVISVGEKGEYVTPKMAKAGDKIIITKGPAIEATGIFATMFPKLMERELGASFSQKAQKIFYKMSVVEDAMTAVRDGTETSDWSYATSLTQLSANWDASSDAQTGISDYYYAIGTLPGQSNVLTWTSTGGAASVTKAGLSLSNGASYYITIKAKNGAGLYSDTISSNGQIADVTEPVSVAAVRDGPDTSDAGYSTSPTILRANWDASSDAQSGIAKYWYAIGTTPGGTQVVGAGAEGQKPLVNRCVGLVLKGHDGRVHQAGATIGRGDLPQ